jgi:drug/metabolite transporter (DMT)-like permease
MGMAAVLLATMCWAAGGTVAGYLFDRGVDPVELVAARTVLTAAGLVGVTVAMPRRRSRPAEMVDLPLVVTCGLAVGAANGFLFAAIAHLPVAVAMVLQNLAPAFVVGWLTVKRRQRITVRVVAGLLAALARVALVVELPTTPVRRLDLVGIGFGVATAAAVATFSLLGTTAARAYGTVRANAYAFTVSSLAWITVLSTGGVPRIITRYDDYAAILFVSLLGTLVPFVLFAWGISRVGPQAGAVNISLEPAFSAVLAWFWLHQALHLVQLVGGVILITAVVYLQRHSRHATPDPPSIDPSVTEPSAAE